MAVLMVQKNIIKRLIKEIQNAKRSGNMSIIPEQTSKYNSRLDVPQNMAVLGVPYPYWVEKV